MHNTPQHYCPRIGDPDEKLTNGHGHGKGRGRDRDDSEDVDEDEEEAPAKKKAKNGVVVSLAMPFKEGRH